MCYRRGTPEFQARNGRMCDDIGNCMCKLDATNICTEFYEHIWIPAGQWVVGHEDPTRGSRSSRWNFRPSSSSENIYHLSRPTVSRNSQAIAELIALDDLIKHRLSRRVSLGAKLRRRGLSKGWSCVLRVMQYIHERSNLRGGPISCLVSMACLRDI